MKIGDIAFVIQDGWKKIPVKLIRIHETSKGYFITDYLDRDVPFSEENKQIRPATEEEIFHYYAKHGIYYETELNYQIY